MFADLSSNPPGSRVAGDYSVVPVNDVIRWLINWLACNKKMTFDLMPTGKCKRS